MTVHGQTYGITLVSYIKSTVCAVDSEDFTLSSFHNGKLEQAGLQNQLFLPLNTFLSNPTDSSPYKGRRPQLLEPRDFLA